MSVFSDPVWSDFIAFGLAKEKPSREPLGALDSAMLLFGFFTVRFDKELAVFVWGHIVILCKCAAEGARALKVRGEGDLVERHTALTDEAVGVARAEHVEIAVEAVANALVEDLGQVGFMIDKVSREVF